MVAVADFTHYDYQLRQRLTSTAMNIQAGWTSRLSPEVLRRTALGDRQLVSGVLSGLQVNVVANTLQVAVSGGLGVMYDATQSDPNSQHRWMEVLDGTPLVATLDGGGANPRWDVVELAPGVVNGVGEILDFYNANTGQFVPAAANPLKVCTPVLAVRKGTEDANPKLPAGIAGCIPLAYVYVAAGAAILNVDRVMHCRPILIPRRGVWRTEDATSLFSPYQEGGGVAGGGWVFAADGFDGTLATSMSGSFPNGGLPFYLPGGTNISLVTAGNYEGGGLPGGNTLVHAYIAPPPYPTGYDSSLAPRELFIQDVTTPGVINTVPAGSRNCIALVSSSTPDQGSPLGLRGGPHVNTGTFTDNLWGAFTRTRASLIYVGAAYHAIGIPGMVTQRVIGARVSPARKTGFEFDGDLPIAAPTQYNLWASIAGDDPMAFPQTARRINVSAEFHLLTTGQLYLKVEDADTGTGGHGLIYLSQRNNTGGTANVGGERDFTVDEKGDIIINAGSVTNIAANGACFRTRSYEDVILAMR